MGMSHPITGMEYQQKQTEHRNAINKVYENGEKSVEEGNGRVGKSSEDCLLYQAVTLVPCAWRW